MKLHINTQKDATESLVISQTDNTTINLPTLFNGDSLPLQIQFVDGQGNVDWRFNASNASSVKVAVGDVDDSIIVSFIDSMTFDSNNFWNGTLVLSTESMATQLLGNEKKNFHFEIQVIKNSGENVTIFQQSVEVRNQLISSSTSLSNTTYSAFVSDPYATPVVDSVIKILSDFENGGRDFTTGEIFLATGYSSTSGAIKLTINGTDFWIGQRGVRWQMISLSEDLTPMTDTDGDGVADNQDAFPNDPNETTDSDGDGVGDNADAFPNDSSETTDTDGDGVGDNADAFPNDPNLSAQPEFMQVLFKNWQSDSSLLEYDSGTESFLHLAPVSSDSYSIEKTTSWTSDGNDGWTYKKNGSDIDYFTTSIDGGQNVLGNMDGFDSDIFQTYKFEITSIDSVSPASGQFFGATAKFGILIVDSSLSQSEKETKTQDILAVYNEYFNQPTGSIWVDTTTQNGMDVILSSNTSTNSYTYGFATLYSYMTTSSGFSVGDEVFIRFE